MFAPTLKEKAAIKVWNAAVIAASTPKIVADAIVAKTSKDRLYSK